MGLFSRRPSGAKAVKSRLYTAIDRATSEFLSAPNLAQNMDVVSTINSAVDPVYASNKACKRICLRLRTRNQRVQYIALHLLENCVRSCGEAFHSQLAKSDLLSSELSRMADRSIWCATDIQRLVLALIQEWAHEVKLREFTLLYEKLKRKGMPFEAREGGLADPRLQPYPGISPEALQGGTQGGPSDGVPLPSSGAHSPRHGKHRHRHDHHAHPNGDGAAAAAAAAAAARGVANLGPAMLRPGRSPAELNADLASAREAVALLTEVLDGAEREANWVAVREEYCAEVAGAVAAVQSRVAALLGAGVSDEAVVGAALEVNDEAQKALDRRQLYSDVADGKTPAPPPPSPSLQQRRSMEVAAVVASTPAAATPEVTVEPVAVASAPAAPVAAVRDPGSLMDLLDLDWTPSAPDTKPTDPFLPPPPMAQPPTNNPFAAAPAALSAEAATATTQQQQPWASMEAPSATDVSPPLALEGGVVSNPFLNDDAFATLGIQREDQHPKAAIPAAALASRPSGNPFAAAPPSPQPPPALQQSLSANFSRPPPVVVPDDASMYLSAPGPLTAPAYPGAASVHHAVQHPYPPTAGAYAPRPQFHFQQQGPSHDDSSMYLSAPPAFQAPYGAPGGAPVTDSFKDLVALKLKKEDSAPPPKGSPMRRGGTPTAAGSAPTSFVGSTFPPAAVPHSTPSNGAVSNGTPKNASAAALSAFDAFDALASGR